MSSVIATPDLKYSAMDYTAASTEPRNWYAIRTRSRHERVVVQQLTQRNVEVFLPLVSSRRQWTDRRVEIETPLFPGYAFVRVAYCSNERVRVLQSHGVAGFVGPNQHAVSIPEEQIDAIRAILLHKVAVEEHPFLRVGQRIRIKGGSLDGLEGLVVKMDSCRRLVLSIEPIQRSISIDLNGYDAEAVN